MIISKKGKIRFKFMVLQFRFGINTTLSGKIIYSSAGDDLGQTLTFSFSYLTYNAEAAAMK